MVPLRPDTVVLSLSVAYTFIFNHFLNPFLTLFRFRHIVSSGMAPCLGFQLDPTACQEIFDDVLYQVNWFILYIVMG